MQQAIAGPVYQGDFRTFIGQLKCYFVAMKIKTKKEFLLSIIPSEMFVLVTDLLSPQNLLDGDVSFEDIVEKLTQHLQPEKSSVVARYEFDSMVRHPSELVQEFVARLQHKAIECKFMDGVRDERLRDRFIAGINDTKMLGSLLLLPADSLTFERVVEKAATLEKIRDDATKMVKHDRTDSDMVAAGRSYNEKCFQGTGNNRRNSPSRWTKNVVCFKCGDLGHIARQCNRSGNEQGKAPMNAQRVFPKKI